MTVTGSIIDKTTGNILKNCEIQQFINGTGFGDHIVSPDGNFSINVSLDANTYFLFSCPGYALLYANTVDILAFGSNNYNAFLTPLTTNAGEKILPIAAAGLGLFLLAQKKKKKVSGIGKFETKDTYPYLIIGGVLIATGAIKKILQTVGIMDSADTKALDQAAANPGSFWNPAYYKQFTTFTASLTAQEAAQDILTIFNSFGLFTDDSETVIALFKNLKTKAEVSYLADGFFQNSGHDLLAWLRGGTWPYDRLSDSEVAQINNYVSQLPSN